MAGEGESRGYDKKFLFGVSIAGLEVGWFETAGPLEWEVGVVEANEGGMIRVASKDAGKVKFSDVVLTIGVTDNTDLYDWCQEVADALADSGEPEDVYKKTVTISALRRNKGVKRRYKLYKAWPKKYKCASFDAKAEENDMEEVTLVYDYWERIDET